MTRIIYILVVMIISLTYVRTKSCDILENMSCECHSSYNGEIEELTCNNNKDSLNTTVKLMNGTIEAGHSFNTFHLTFYDLELNVSSMFINELSYLFRRSLINQQNQKSRIKITLSFPYFLQLHFEDYSFYQLFTENSDFITILILELTSNGQVTFSPNAFSQLIVDQMILHSSSLEPYSFEEIFNNTNIGELTMEGLTPRSNDTNKINFNGKIRSAKFTKMVETVSSEEFPNYPVRSMTIEAHEARKINTSTFLNYRNLHGLHLIRPKFFFDNRSFDGLQYLTSLETIELDAETLKDHTFQHTSRIRFLTLGQNLRYLSEHSLDDLNYLTRFDASKVILDQLYPTSKCILARYIRKQLKINPLINILPPQAEYCDCIYDFITTILNKKPDQSYIDLCSDNQQERCQLNQCNVVKNFRIPIKKDNQQENNTDISISSDHKLPSYVHRHPSQTDNHIGSSDTDIQDSQTSALIANKPVDPNALPFDDYDEYSNPTSTIDNSQTITNISEERRLALKNETLKWIALILVCITILCILLIGTLIWFVACRRTARYKPVPPNSSNV